MDTVKNDEIHFDFPPFLRVYKDGRAERILPDEFIPPSIDPSTGVSSKDVIIQPETGLSARLYLPKITHNNNHQKLPLLIYFHGGGFCIERAFSPAYHGYVNSLVAQANVVAMSVDYRRAPDHPLPVAYEDSWAALHWVASQSQQEEWLSKYADLDQVFMAGDSAGANIAHNMAIRMGTGCEPGLVSSALKIDGIVLIHPFFAGVDPIGSEVGNIGTEMGRKLWSAVCPSTTGVDDPLINPAKDSSLSKLGCKRILVCVAEKDALRDRGEYYCQEVGRSGWKGEVELMQVDGEGHVFHLFNPVAEKAKDMMNRVVAFIAAEPTSWPSSATGTACTSSSTS